MRLFGIKNEFEVYTGNIIKLSKGERNKKLKLEFC